MKPSNNNSIVAGFVSWSQDKMPMKLLDTLFKMVERNLGLGGRRSRLLE